MISGVFPGNFFVLAIDRGIRTRPRPTKYKNGVSWPFRAGLGGRFGSRVYGATQISIRILLEQAHPLFSTSPSTMNIYIYIYIYVHIVVSYRELLVGCGLLMFRRRWLLQLCTLNQRKAGPQYC